MKPLPSARWLVTLGGSYAAAALAWSLFGLLTPVAPAHFHEYSLAALVVEVGGHLIWGAAAGVFTRDPALALLVTGESILIDVDHIFSALNLPMEPRVSHSIFFALFVALLLAYLGGGPPGSAAECSGRPSGPWRRTSATTSTPATPSSPWFRPSPTPTSTSRTTPGSPSRRSPSPSASSRGSHVASRE